MTRVTVAADLPRIREIFNHRIDHTNIARASLIAHAECRGVDGVWRAIEAAGAASAAPREWAGFEAASVPREIGLRRDRTVKAIRLATRDPA